MLFIINSIWLGIDSNAYDGRKGQWPYLLQGAAALAARANWVRSRFTSPHRGASVIAYALHEYQAREQNQNIRQLICLVKFIECQEQLDDLLLSYVSMKVRKKISDNLNHQLTVHPLQDHSSLLHHYPVVRFYKHIFFKLRLVLFCCWIECCFNTLWFIFNLGLCDILEAQHLVFTNQNNVLRPLRGGLFQGVCREWIFYL